MCSSWVRSGVTFSGITTFSAVALAASRSSPARCRCCPEVGSRIVWPGLIAPFSSASSISARATRSLTEPVGLRDSSFAQMRTPGFGESFAQLDERRVADRLDDVAVAASARPVPEPLRRHYFTEYSDPGNQRRPVADSPYVGGYRHVDPRARSPRSPGRRRTPPGPRRRGLRADEDRNGHRGVRLRGPCTGSRSAGRRSLRCHAPFR